MNKAEVLKKIQVLLGLHKFDEATLVDGTKITNKSDEKFGPGQNLFVLDAEGKEVAAPEGSHTTESGITLTVDGAGVITGVKEPDEKGEGSLEAKEEDDDKMKMGADSSILDVAEAVVESGMSPEAILELVAPIVEEIAAVKEEVAKMKKAFEDYKNGPAKESMKKSFSKLNFGKADNEVVDAYSRIAALKKELHKK